MPEVKTIKRFDRCPWCGESGTITELACRPLVEKGTIPSDAPVSGRKEVIPLLDPHTAALTVPVLVKHWDTCVHCGRDYCVRAETIDAPIQMQQPKGSGQGLWGGLFGNPR